MPDPLHTATETVPIPQPVAATYQEHAARRGITRDALIEEACRAYLFFLDAGFRIDDDQRGRRRPPSQSAAEEEVPTPDGVGRGAHG